MKTKSKTLRGRVVSCALALTLAIGLMPIGAFAAVDGEHEAIDDVATPQLLDQPVRYVVRFSLNGDWSNKPNDIEIEKCYEEQFTLTIPDQIPLYKDDSCQFDGWLTSSSFGRVVLYPGDEFTLRADGNTYLYLHINIKRPYQYRVRFSGNGAITNDPDCIEFESYEDSAQITIPDLIPLRPGYIFQGWSRNPEGTQLIHPGDQMTITGDDCSFLLYAAWEKDYGPIDPDPPGGSGGDDEPVIPPEEVVVPDDPGDSDDPDTSEIPDPDDPFEPGNSGVPDVPDEPGVPTDPQYPEDPTEQGSMEATKPEGQNPLTPSVEEDKEAEPAARGLQALAQTSDPALCGVLLSTSPALTVLLAMMASALHRRRCNHLPKE